MLTLYILPPAFGLPSIDPECLATVYYMRRAVPHDQWQLVPDVYGIGNGAAGDWTHLPALWDGRVQISGYLKIVEYLKILSGGRWSIETGNEDANWLLANNVHNRVSPLLSLLFYTSSDNYTATIRPAFGKELPFPSSWVLPHNHRRQQQESVDMAQLEITASQLSTLAASLTSKPKALPANPLSSRTDPLTDDEILNLYPKEKIPKGNTPSAVIEGYRRLKEMVARAFEVYTDEDLVLTDVNVHTCTLFAHLGLALAASRTGMPHAWLTDALQSQHPSLARQTIRWLREEDGWNFARSTPSQMSKLELPWHIQDSSVATKSLALGTGVLQLSGFRQLHIPAAMFARSVSTFTDGHVHFDSDQPRGKPLGHEVDAYWLGTTAFVSAFLVYRAWKEGL